MLDLGVACSPGLDVVISAALREQSCGLAEDWPDIGVATVANADHRLEPFAALSVDAHALHIVAVWHGSELFKDQSFDFGGGFRLAHRSSRASRAIEVGRSNRLARSQPLTPADALDIAGAA